jgi:hypothetical protein
MKIDLEAKAIRTASWGLKALILGVMVLVLAVFGGAARWFRPLSPA